MGKPNIVITEPGRKRIKHPGGRLKRTPFDPITGKYLTRNDQELTKVFQVVEESEDGDYIICLRDNEHSSDCSANLVEVAKPYLLQQTPFDGLTVNEVSYVYSGLGERTASKEGEDDEVQTLAPSYYEGESIVVGRVHADSLFEEASGWFDMNTAGRRWESEPNVLNIIKITGLHSDSPTTGVRVYTGSLSPNGWYAGSPTTGVTIMIPGIAADVESPSYGAWSDSVPFLSQRVIYTWTGAASTHTNDVVYEAYPGQLML